MDRTAQQPDTDFTPEPHRHVATDPDGLATYRVGSPEKRVFTIPAEPLADWERELLALPEPERPAITRPCLVDQIEDEDLYYEV